MKLTDEELEFNPATFAVDDVRDTYAIGGADLSATTDLTCASLIIHTTTDDTPFVLQQYFIPEKRVKDIETMNTQEAPYRKWADELKEMIAETLKKNDNSDDDKDKDTKKESDDGTDAN